MPHEDLCRGRPTEVVSDVVKDSAVFRPQIIFAGCLPILRLRCICFWILTFFFEPAGLTAARSFDHQRLRKKKPSSHRQLATIKRYSEEDSNG